MVNYFGLAHNDWALITLTLEIIFIILLGIGWWWGSRQLNFTLHHFIVYPVIIINLLVIYSVMIASAAWRFDRGFALNEIWDYVLLVHMIGGIIAEGLAITLIVIFFLEPRLPLKILKRARVIMFTTIITWVVTFCVGCLIYINKYVEFSSENGNGYD